jgi:hypothetical protein
MGLIKTAAKVAVASSVHGRVQRRQQNRWAAQDQARWAAQDQSGMPAAPTPSAPPPAAPPPTASAPPADTGDRITQLKQLGELLSAGVLNQAEFEQEKARILNG